MNYLKIEKVYYQALNGNPIRAPRKRFTQYYADLFASAHLQPVNKESYLQGAQYSYVELLDSLMPQIQADGNLADLELIVFSFWSPEFDPEHACGAYLSHRYQFFGKILDISDCGFLSPFTALAAIQVYMQKGGLRRALLLSMDQTTVPHSAAMSAVKAPQCSSICAWFILAHAAIQPGRQLILSSCVADQQLRNFLQQQIANNQINLSSSLLTVNPDDDNSNFKSTVLSLPFKNIVYTMQAANSVEKLCALKIIRHINEQSRYEYHILLVQDYGRKQWGVCIVRIIL